MAEQGEEANITSNSIYSIKREEERNKILNNLPPKFYSLLYDFLKKKKKLILESKQKQDTTKQRTQTLDYHNTKKTIENIIYLRLSKIMRIVVTNKIFNKDIMSNENILPEEKKYYNEIENSIKNFKENIKILK